jgi:hypothetical protein
MDPARHGKQGASQTMSSRLVRLALGAGCAVAALAVPAGTATAIPPTCDPTQQICEPVMTTENATRKLTVARSAGTVTSTPAGIDCGSDCVQSTIVSRECIDGECGSWPDSTSYTLSASGGPAGYSANWSDCGVTPTCTVHLGDAEQGGHFEDVDLTWVDTTAPTTAFAPPAEVGPSNYNVTAGGSDNSGSIARYAWTVDNVAQAATGSVLSLAGFSNGNHTVTVRAYDAANNAGPIVSKTVAVDKVVGVSVTPLPAVTNAATVPLSFTTDADVVARACSLDGGAYGACTTGWSGITAATADGTHTYRVKVTDNVGNVAESALQTTVVDRTLPVLSFTDGPTEGQQVVTRNASITFSMVEARPASVKCKLDAGAFANCTPGTAVELIGLTDGPHVLTVQAIDTAGNVRTISRTFAVQVPSTGGDEDPGGEQDAGGGETPGGTTTTTTTTTTGGGTPTTTTGGGPVTGTPAATFAPRFTHTYAYAGKVTRFTSMAIRSLPKSAKVTVKCKGSGCAGKSKTLKHSGGKLNVLKALKRLKLKAGATLQITVRGEGGAQSIAKFVVRAGKRPKVSYRCAKAGGKLGACG